MSSSTLKETVRREEIEPLPDYYGPPFCRPFAAILNSRRPRSDCKEDNWKKATVRAARFCAREGYTVLTSVKPSNWDYAVKACLSEGARQIIFLPGFSGEDYRETARVLRASFGLTCEEAGFYFFPTEVSPAKPKAAWPARDRIICREASLLLPVSVRPGGNIFRYTRLFSTAVDDRFRIPYP